MAESKAWVMHDGRGGYKIETRSHKPNDAIVEPPPGEEIHWLDIDEEVPSATVNEAAKATFLAGRAAKEADRVARKAAIKAERAKLSIDLANLDNMNNIPEMREVIRTIAKLITGEV